MYSILVSFHGHTQETNRKKMCEGQGESGKRDNTEMIPDA